MRNAKFNPFVEGETFFDLWKADKDSMVVTMTRNLQADLDAGYNPNGRSIRQQVAELAEYQKEYAEQLEMFKTMTDKQVQHWCKYDMIKRGAIE